MNLSFKSKLIGLCVFLCSVSVVISILSYRGLHSVEDSYDEITDGVMPNLNLLNDMYLDYRSIRINLRSLGISGLSKEEAQGYVEHVIAAIESYEKNNKTYEEFPFHPGEKEIYDKLELAWHHFKEIGVNALKYYKENTPESMEKLNKIFRHDCPEAAKKFTEAIVELKTFHTENGKRFRAEAQDRSSFTNQLVILTSIMGILIGLIVGFIFSSKVSSSITVVARQLASNADQVAEASSQIAASSQELSQAVTEQASSLEETAASLEEITSMIAKATDNSETASHSSAASHRKAEQGREVVEQMLFSMDEISQSNEAILVQINDSNRQMSEIVKVIQDIGNRTKVINEIVFQTKLLSFNASVEAARAGEQGKGFAVVAEEVGNLAQMSGNAAKEITEMLGASISKVEGIVIDTQQKVEKLVQRGKDKVDVGITVAKQCSELLNEIVQDVSKVSNLSQEISHAAKEQAQGVAEINKAMSQLDTVTQQNASSSEQTASSAEELSAQAESLKSSVANLEALILGNKRQLALEQNSNSKIELGQINSNVVSINSAKMNEKKFATKSSKAIGKAVGESSTPHCDDEGFNET